MSLEESLGTDPLFRPRGQYRQVPTLTVLILEYGSNPSTDYYIMPRVASLDAVALRTVDMRRTPPEAVVIPDQTFVVIVRYLTSSWGHYLGREKGKLTGVAYFLDDDLALAIKAPGLPLRYRYKVLRLFQSKRALLSSICSRIWVSTRYLAERYGLPASAVLEPQPVVCAAIKAPITYFYAGTAAHWREFVWLQAIVKAVQESSLDLTFVTFGDVKIRRLFERFPRVICLHPVPWRTFVDSLSILQLDIGLAPLIDSRFNRGRSYTKFYDITRMGAVGIYTDVPPYSGFVRAGVDGVLVNNELEAWRLAILELASSPERRTSMRNNAQDRVATRASPATGLFS
jgi:glycosyltransferase involved in cell wall biosynthesis